MPELSFYHQQRVDNGIRTGIEIDGETVLHHFQKGDGDSDPVLRWFVDLRCKGPRLPHSAEEARQWFLKNAPVIHRGLQTLAAELRAGMEPEVLPLRWQIPNPPRGVEMTIVCSASRRVDALEIAKVLQGIDQNWENQLAILEVNEPLPR